MPNPDKYLEKSEKRLEAAKILLENHKYEDLTDRIYYSIYNSVKGLLKTESQPPNTHREIIKDFGEKFIRSGKIDRKYATIFSRAESLWESSKYGLNPEISYEEAGDMIKKGEDFLNMAKEKIEKKE